MSVLSSQHERVLYPWSPPDPLGDTPDVYDPYGSFTEEHLAAELAYAKRCTARYDMYAVRQSGYAPYETDQAIMQAVARGELVKVIPTTDAFLPIHRLQVWQPEVANYSPPYLRPESLLCLQGIARHWRDDIGEDAGVFRLSVTSLVRSTDYQEKLVKNPRKVAADPGASSHQYGLAFDIDARGLYEATNTGWRPVNNMDPQRSRRQKVASLMTQLEAVLDEKMFAGEISYIDELPHTQNACFHICAMPNERV